MPGACWVKGEGELPNLAPIHLQVLPRQALEAHRHGGHGLRLRLGQSLPPHRLAEHGVPALVRTLRVLAG